MKEKKVKVSIIVPIYNVEKYLKQCIESIINQTYKNIEIILVNDGSTDSSKEIIDYFSNIDKRIIAIHKENRGVSNARNVGMSNSTGEYITFLDADDYFMPDYIEYFVNLIIKENADIAISKMFFDNYNKKSSINENVKIYTKEKALKEILTYNINVAVWNKMYRANMLKEKNIRFYEEIFMGEGFNFNILAFKNSNKIVISNKKVYYYRRDNEDSATTKFKIEKWKNALYAIDTMYENINDEDETIIEAWEFAKWRTNVDAFTLLCTSQNEKKYREFYKSTKEYGKKKFYLSIKLNTSFKDIIRSITMIICPLLLPKLIIFRRKIFNVKVKN